jgi:hypothetical protein
VVFPANFDFRLERMPFAIHMKEMDRTAGSTIHYKKDLLNRCSGDYLVSIWKPRNSPPSLRGEGQGGGDNDWDIKPFHFYSPHPAPLPRGERDFSDENYLISREPERPRKSSRGTHWAFFLISL